MHKRYCVIKLWDGLVPSNFEWTPREAGKRERWEIRWKTSNSIWHGERDWGEIRWFWFVSHPSLALWRSDRASPPWRERRQWLTDERRWVGWGWSEGGKGKGEGRIEDKGDRKCNPIPSKRESLSRLKQKAMERTALGRLWGSDCPKQTAYPGSGRNSYLSS